MSHKLGSLLILLCLTPSLTKGLTSKIASQCTRAGNISMNIRCSSVEEIGDFKFPNNLYVKFQGKEPSQVVNATIFQHNSFFYLEFQKCLRKLNPGDFQHLNSEDLFGIKFSDNVLNELVPGVFNHLLIQELFLNNSQIKFLYPGVFSNMSNLQKLEITGNEIGTIMVGVFNNLPITALVLNNNQIHYIVERAFHNLTKLSRLYLVNNRLSVFNGQELFNYQTSIRKLLLNRNLLPNITTQILRGFKNLKHLFLQDNLISTIDANAFHKNRNLSSLQLRSNKLKEISADIFPARGLQDLRYVNLQNNELSFLSLNFLHALRSVYRLLLSGNPWQCGCLRIILQWMKEQENLMIDDCEGDSFKGIRPVCMVLQRHSDACVYKIFEENIKNYVDIRNSFEPYDCYDY